MMKIKNILVIKENTKLNKLELLDLYISEKEFKEYIQENKFNCVNLYKIRNFGNFSKQKQQELKNEQNTLFLFKELKNTKHFELTFKKVL